MTIVLIAFQRRGDRLWEVLGQRRPIDGPKTLNAIPADQYGSKKILYIVQAVEGEVALHGLAQSYACPKAMDKVRHELPAKSPRFTTLSILHGRGQSEIFLESYRSKHRLLLWTPTSLFI